MIAPIKHGGRLAQPDGPVIETDFGLESVIARIQRVGQPRLRVDPHVGQGAPPLSATVPDSSSVANDSCSRE